MKPDAYTADDLELLSDLERAARAVGVEPCLIGAGAIRLGPALEWSVRPRATRDWDFAVHIDSWSELEALVGRLTAPDGRFERGSEPHRFVHRSGGVLDVLPYGQVEEPLGEIRWSDGVTLDTRGLSVLDKDYTTRRIEDLERHVASLPALIGLEVLAYRARRPGVTRDIGDVHRMLVEFEDAVEDGRIAEEAFDRLTSGDVSIGEVGAYLLGRDVGRIFANDDRSLILAILDEAPEETSPVVPDIRRAADSAAGPRERVLERLAAVRLGMLDR